VGTTPLPWRLAKLRNGQRKLQRRWAKKEPDMELELVTTKKRLTKGIVEQLPHLPMDLWVGVSHDLSSVLGFVQLPKDAYAIIDLPGRGGKAYKLRLTQDHRDDLGDAYHSIYTKAVSVQIFYG
jgi:hypothetical protein